jgi:hypothetical protein
MHEILALTVITKTYFYAGFEVVINSNTLWHVTQCSPIGRRCVVRRPITRFRAQLGLRTAASLVKISQSEMAQ